MQLRALPYRRPDPKSVAAAEWRLVLDGEESPLPESYPYWDYQTVLTLRRRVEIDAERVIAESRLAPGTGLTLSVVWTATGSSLRGPGARVEVSHSGPVDLELSLPGADLGGMLQLDTVLVLSQRRIGSDRPVAPRRAGSVLWSDRHSIRLQGDAPQFPMAIIDFEKTTYPEHAAWYLEIGTNLEAATMGSLLLLVNERKRVVAAALENAAKPRVQDRITLAMVYADVARIMVEHALAQPEFQDSAIFPDDSLGVTLQALFARLFPATTISEIRALANRSPSRLAADVQAAVDNLGSIA
ncbi:hypothetical protein [Nocardia huaxiensis]|uniref:hypothetical protein n=1 Tax=Nocardia huaxiensis TaxID=2755382 RepID=UPI001E40B8CF|nr:hypothetical protein [Nocardia huaxiensis]UFS96412.1 hypothetical protein LPY97_00235 [Nocardia huaxiensis]